MKPSEAAIDRTALNLSLENITTLIPSPLEALKKQNSNENGMERSMGKNGDDSDSTGENSIEDLHNSEWDGLDFLDLKSTREETTQVGNYILGGLLGSGSFGKVYKGLHKSSGKFVAIKQIGITAKAKDMDINSPQKIQEVEILKKLDHPNILKFIDVIETKQYTNIIFEFVENGSLKDIVAKFGNFPESLAKVYIMQLLNGLKYLHEKDIVHRDIKGANVLITKEGTCKLADFGLAAQVINNDTKAAGTPYWMAPELFECGMATKKSDVWSLGCTIIELLTGRPPFWELGSMAAMYNIVEGEVVIPSFCTPELTSFLKGCFQKDVNLRSSAADLIKHEWITGNSPSPSQVGLGALTEALKTHRRQTVESPHFRVRGGSSHSHSSPKILSFTQNLKDLSIFFSKFPSSSRHVTNLEELQSHYDKLINSVNNLFTLAYSLDRELKTYMREADDLSQNWQTSINKSAEITKNYQNILEKLEKFEGQFVLNEEKYAKLIYGDNLFFNSFHKAKKGVLKVRGDHAKTFKKRFVVLKDNFLLFYRSSETEEDPRDVVWLNQITITPLAKGTSPLPHTFNVTTRKKHYQLASANENIMLGWMKSISFCKKWYEDHGEGEDEIETFEFDKDKEQIKKTYENAEGFLSFTAPSAIKPRKSALANTAPVPFIQSHSDSAIQAQRAVSLPSNGHTFPSNNNNIGKKKSKKKKKHL